MFHCGDFQASFSGGLGRYAVTVIDECLTPGRYYYQLIDDAMNPLTAVEADCSPGEAGSGCIAVDERDASCLEGGSGGCGVAAPGNGRPALSAFVFLLMCAVAITRLHRKK